MKAGPQNLMTAYATRLKALLATQQRSKKCLSKLSFAAFTDELRTGLSPDSFDMPEHTWRLKQCVRLAGLKASGAVEDAVATLLNQEAVLALKSGRMPSVMRDLQLLHSGLKILNMGQCACHELFLMAEALGEDVAATMLEQCWKDYQNAYNYLVQISSNIIYPAAEASQVVKPE